MQTQRTASLVCAAVALVACATADDPSMVSRRDVATVRDGQPGVDSGPGVMDVAAMDVPSGPMDVPTVIADTGVCPAGRMACAGSGCVDTQTDRANCGGCDIDCGAARVCQRGMCACPMGTTMCGAGCVNTMTDSMNCGACGSACPANHMCVAGACRLNCPMPGSICVSGAVMSCVNLQTDPSNCGACATACRVPNATSACAGGQCTVGMCNAGFGNCDNNAANGCEATLDSLANCGACGMACPPVANGSPACTGGACNVNCNPGFANCDGNVGNGCEVNVQSDAANCGACGNRCAAGQACVAGGCRAGNMLVGQYNVSSGPAWGSNPPTYTCQEACALLFGGAPGSYQCSISNAMITRTANTSIWGVAGCAIVGDTVKRAATYNCGAANCSQSAYVADNCSPGTNFCFR
jgi:hypothetical protein